MLTDNDDITENGIKKNVKRKIFSKIKKSN